MYSAAFNSFDHLSGSANPATGTFSFSHTFGPVQADGRFGPKCNLIVSYSLLSTMIAKNYTGLGKGYSFRLGSYNNKGKTLTLNSGASYIVLSANCSHPWKLSHKLNDIRVEQEYGKINIYHKNGDHEIMDVDPQSQDAVLTRFTSANGRYLRFKYQSFLGYKRLTEVHDKEHLLAKVKYNDNEGSTIIVTHPNTPDAKTSTLYMTPDGFLKKIELLDGEIISFKYQKFLYGGSQAVLHPIKSVSYSNGASEEMEYNEKLHLPPDAPVPYTPGITKLTKIIATNQPPVITTFTYRGKDGQPARNYWGYNSGMSYGNYTDGLFNYPSHYHYTSTTKTGDHVIQHKYNKFHQKISTIVTNGDPTKQQITTHEYYSDESKSLDEQSATFELMKMATTRYQSSTGVSCDHNKSYEYDDYGNVTMETDVHGVRTVSEYYPPEGGNGCPAHPHGMVAYVKQRSHISSDGLLKKSFSYTYQSIPRIGGGNMIVPASQTHNGIKKTYTYHDSSDQRIQGTQEFEITTINGKSTTNSTNYEFLSNDTICITDTITGHDGLSTNKSTTLSYWNGLVKQKTNENGVITNYTYDNSGRTLSVTTGVGTDYQVTMNYQYVHNPRDPSTGNPLIGLSIIQESTTGATVQTFYDGDEKELATYEKDEYGILRKLSEKNYDKQEREMSHVQYDYIISQDGDHNIKKTMSECVTTLYDTWGSKCETVHSDGTIHLSINDPINSQVTHQVVCRDSTGKIVNSLHSTKSTLNLFGKPTKVEVFDKCGALYSTTSFDYDQFGRKTRVTNPNGSSSEIIQYDKVDRPLQFTHNDGTLFQVSYADMSIQSLVSSITVPSMNVTLGQQEYDGLSRVTCKTVNGVKTQYSYKNGYKQPSRRINGRGQTILFDYIPELDMHPSRVLSFSSEVEIDNWNDPSKISESVYSYGKSDNPSTLGHILSTTSPAAHYKYEYSSFGALKATKRVVGSQSQTITTESSTMKGKPLAVTIDDRKILYNYNDHGHVTSIVDRDIMTQVSMDEFSRVSEKKVYQYNPKSGAYDELLQTTDLKYDEYSREISRIITVEKSSKIISIKSSYDTDNKLIQRIMAINDIDSLTESYSYDSKRRLIAYEVTKHTTSTLLPLNENGKPFTSQSFAFDGLDNITSIVTGFPNGDTDTATFSHDQTNKQRLIGISHTLITGSNAYPSKITFHYDADGNLTSYKDSVMTYTASGRLASKDDTVYTYDAFDKLVASNDTVRIYSDHGHVVQEINDSGTTDFIRYGDIPIGEIQSGNKKIYGVDKNFTTVSVTNDTSTTAMIYSPYGHGDNGARIGLNGQLRDIADSNVYHLGNGTRTYFPSFNGFSTADSYSPFLGGGINPYKYCNGDPINCTDPSGHVSWGQYLTFGIALGFSVFSLITIPFTAGTTTGMFLGAFSALCGIASASLGLGADIAADKKNKKLARGLSLASTAVGLFAIPFDIADIVVDALYVGKVVKEAQVIYQDVAVKHFNYGIDVSPNDLEQYTIGYFWKLSFPCRRPKRLQIIEKRIAGLNVVNDIDPCICCLKWVKEPIKVFTKPGNDVIARSFWSACFVNALRVKTVRQILTIITDLVDGGLSAYNNINDFFFEDDKPCVTKSVQSAYDLPINKPTHHDL